MALKQLRVMAAWVVIDRVESVYEWSLCAHRGDARRAFMDQVEGPQDRPVINVKGARWIHYYRRGFRCVPAKFFLA